MLKLLRPSSAAPSRLTARSLAGCLPVLSLSLAWCSSLSLVPAAMSKSTERFSLFGDERKELTEAEEAYRLHSTAMNPDYRLQPTIGAGKRGLSARQPAIPSASARF